LACKRGQEEEEEQTRTITRRKHLLLSRKTGDQKDRQAETKRESGREREREKQRPKERDILSWTTKNAPQSSVSSPHTKRRRVGRREQV
jgi:hypothetical protein